MCMVATVEARQVCFLIAVALYNLWMIVKTG